LTRRIQSLEQFVGAPLFERHHNAVELNERGHAFLDEVAPHLDALALAVERATDEGRAMRIRIAVPSLYATQKLVPALPSLRERHPNLLIDIETGANRISRIGEGLDAAIAITDVIDDRHHGRLVEKGRIIALGARSLLEGEKRLRDPSDLRRVPILLHRQMPRAFDEWKRAAGYKDLEAAHVNYYDAGQLILDAAAEGLGIAFMLESHLAFSTDDRLTQVFPQSADSPYSYWFVCPQSSLERRPIRIFHDWLFDHSDLVRVEPDRKLCA
jgi:LysR family glycine cleavage system transcriptional activator